MSEIKIEEVLATIQELDKETEQLLIEEATVDGEIANLLAKIRRTAGNTSEGRRFITSFEVVNQRLISPWIDPADLPTTRSTYDVLNQHLVKEWSDPTLLPKQPTTHDIATASLTQEWVSTAD